MKWKKLIAAVLLIALCVGILAIFAGGEEVFGFLGDSTTAKTTAATAVPGGSSPAVTTAQQVNVVGSKIPTSDGEAGYITIDNTTYFFVRIDYDPGRYYIKIYDWQLEYLDYERKYYISTDLTTFLYAAPQETPNEDIVEIYSDSLCANKTFCYLTYTVINNCSNPEAIFQDLKTNVFGTDYFKYSVGASGDVTEVAPS